jgi:hypothetical protein
MSAARIQFGVFDHLDVGAAPLGQHYENRLRLIEAYDRLGLRTYHLAEHHATPLGLAPSPSVFLAAVAQRTQRLRFGPLVYTLSLHHPLRVAEEICMLDNMSGTARVRSTRSTPTASRKWNGWGSASPAHPPRCATC